MMAESTLEHMHTLFTPVPGFVCEKLASVGDVSHDRLVREMRDRKDELLRDHEYLLEPDRRRELERIYRDAGRHLV